MKDLRWFFASRAAPKNLLGTGWGPVKTRGSDAARAGEMKIHSRPPTATRRRKSYSRLLTTRSATFFSSVFCFRVVGVSDEYSLSNGLGW
jgi:hypothetical protein